MAILYKKKKTSYQDGGSIDKTTGKETPVKKTKKPLIGSKGKDSEGNNVLSSGGFGKATEVSMKDEKKQLRQSNKKKRIQARIEKK